MIPWTVASQAPLSMGISRQEYWNELPCPPPGDVPNPGTEPRSPTWQVDSLLSEQPGNSDYSEVAQSCLTLYDPMGCQIPLSIRFSRQEYWNELPCPPSGDLLDSGIKPRSPALQADSLPSEPSGKPRYYDNLCKIIKIPCELSMGLFFQ